MSEKLQKVLARAGLGSRRLMEELIAAGRVKIDGEVATLGSRVELNQEIRIDGRKIFIKPEEDIKKRVIIYYKPEGEICSKSDPEGRPTAFDRLPTISRSRWVMVGRLDINSSGLLLFTNDGDLANDLMHPSTAIEREYAVRVMGEVTPQIVKALTRGVELEDGFAKFESFKELGGEGINRWYQVVVKEGRNREVRRLFESQELKVSRLLRTRYGNVHLPRALHTGKLAELTKEEVAALEFFVKEQKRAARQATETPIAKAPEQVQKRRDFRAQKSTLSLTEKPNFKKELNTKHTDKPRRLNGNESQSGYSQSGYVSRTGRNNNKGN